MKRQIDSGVYLVIDPSLEKSILLQKLSIVLEEKIVAVQLWDNFLPGENNVLLIQDIVSICHEKNVPVLINNKWELIKEFGLD